jgi:hypothetical protein
MTQITEQEYKTLTEGRAEDIIRMLNRFGLSFDTAEVIQQTVADDNVTYWIKLK